MAYSKRRQCYRVPMCNIVNDSFYINIQCSFYINIQCSFYINIQCSFYINIQCSFYINIQCSKLCLTLVCPTYFKVGSKSIDADPYLLTFLQTIYHSLQRNQVSQHPPHQQHSLTITSQQLLLAVCVLHLLLFVS